MHQVAVKPVKSLRPVNVNKPSKELVDRGMEVLDRDPAARSFLISLWRKYGEAPVMRAIASAEETQPVDAKSWLVACLQQRPKQPKRPPEEILQQCGLSERMTKWFIQDVLKPAKALHLFDMDNDGILAARLADLYAQIRYGRDLASLLVGPLGLLQRYIQWLGERDWDASSKVLMMDSPAFAQFRRDYARLEGRDPITGLHRYRD
jgi:hypothetical protein